MYPLVVNNYFALFSFFLNLIFPAAFPAHPPSKALLGCAKKETPHGKSRIGASVSPKMPSDSLINALRLAGGRRRLFFAHPLLMRARRRPSDRMLPKKKCRFNYKNRNAHPRESPFVCFAIIIRRAGRRCQ